MTVPTLYQHVFARRALRLPAPYLAVKGLFVSNFFARYIIRFLFPFFKNAKKKTKVVKKAYKNKNRPQTQGLANLGTVCFFGLFLYQILDDLARYDESDHRWHEGDAAWRSLTARIDGRLVGEYDLQVVDTSLA